MADYYPLIARAVAGLEKSTGEARRALYERARTALVTQLRGVVPALSESDITRERLALEESIRKVEAEAARRTRPEAPAPKAPAPPPVEAPRREERAAAPPPPPRRDPSAEPPTVAAPPPRPPRPRPEQPTSLTDEGLKGFRDVVAESNELGGAAAQASRSAREAFNAVPSSSGEYERQEPRMEPEGLRPTPPNDRPARERPARDAGREARDALREARREQTREPDRGYASQDEYSGAQETLEPAIHVPDSRPSPPSAGKPSRPAAPPPRPPARSAEIDEERPKLPRRSYRGLITFVVLLLILGGVGAGAYWQRDKLMATYQSVFNKAAPKPTARDPNVAQQRPKIADRIEPNSQNQPGGQTPPAAQVAQRAVLYEEDPADPQGKRFQGSVIWRTEQVPVGAGQPPELAVRADVEIPDRRITMTFSLRRNTDQALPASHTVEVMFNLPADFPGGGISNVPGVLMKQAEATRGVPLAGLAVKVTTGFFLIGLSAVDADVQRNISLLKERSWFDVPVVYNNGTRAILAIEKGTPGERAFEAAFRTWGVK